MKTRFSVLSVFCVVLILATVSMASGESGKMMSVQVKRGEVRATPYFLGKIIGILSYGDRVEVLDSRGSWFRVAPPGKAPPGWMHSSALSEKRIVLKAGKQDAEVAASGGELALAGKGFNADVEAEFKARHRDVDFSWIDRMEAINIPPEKAAAFLQEGGLTPVPGGGG